MNPFTAHPRASGQNYVEHWSFAMGVALDAVVAGCTAAVHAFLPFVLQTSASQRLDRLHARIEAARRAPAPK
jgi:hypothetical protein